MCILASWSDFYLQTNVVSARGQVIFLLKQKNGTKKKLKHFELFNTFQHFSLLHHMVYSVYMY